MLSVLPLTLPALLGLLALPAHAQSIASRTEASPAAGQASVQERSLLEQPARLKVENVVLSASLKELHRRSGVALAFSPSLLPKMHRVTCRCERLTVGEALDQILSGTGFHYVDLGPQILIELGQQPVWSREPYEQSGVARRIFTANPVATPVPTRTERPRAAAGTVTGTVVEAATQRPLTGVQMTIPGSGLGTLTNSVGRYMLLNVPSGQVTVRAQLIGYGPAETTVTVRDGESVTADFQLTPQALALDEVVVTGTAGAARRREIGNSITQINMAETIDRPVSMDAALQARVPGMTVLQSSGQLGSGAQIRLRGNTSVSMSNQPLIYVDGIRVRSEGYPKNTSGAESNNRSNNDVQSPLNDINPADIERIEVIKGAAATTLYGTEAAAGVIQIFTRRGRTGAARWTLDVDQSVSRMRPFSPEPEPYLYLEPWLRDAHSQKYNLSVQGGGETLTYFVSGNFEDNKGVLPLDQQDRYGLRGNVGFSPLPNMQLQWNTMYARSETQNTPTGNNSHGLLLNVYRQEQNYANSADKAVIDEVLEYEITSGIDRMTTGLTLSYAPFGIWNNRFTVGYDLAHNELRQVRPWGFVLAPEGRMSNRQFRSSLLTLDFVSSLNLKLTDNLRSTLSLGAQSATTEEITVDGYSANFPGPSQPTLTTGSLRQSFEDRIRLVTGGFFAQNLFDFHNRYFLTLGVRVDGSSAFGSAFGLQAYPKASLAYVISEEPFWPDALGETKLRMAYGQAGRAPGAFDAIRTWDPAGWGGEPAYLPLNVGNPNIGPERTAETEVGFESALFNQRLLVDFTYYYQRTQDALFRVRQIPSVGFQTAQLANVGEIENKGMELVLNGSLVRTPSLTWDLGTSIATNHSKVISLGGAPSFSVGGQGWIIEGEPVPAIRGTRVLNPREVADPVLERDVILGPNQPTLIVGLRSSLHLPREIRLSARGEYQGGHWIDDSGSSNAQQRGIVSWPTCLRAHDLIAAERQNELTAIERQRCVVSNYLPRSHIYPADFFKLREVSLRFPVPVQLPGMQSVSVTLAGHNVFRWLNEDFPIFDPEMMANDGMHQTVRSMNEQYPQPATYTASVRVVF